MLSFYSNNNSRDCEGVHRRDFLRIGSLGLAGLSLADLLALRSQAAQAGKHIKNKSVVFLFLRGGPTQYETWDPKMTAPAEIRSMSGETQTKIPGVTIGGHFKKLAAMADRMAFVRSFNVGTGSHGAGRTLITTGGNPLKAPLGSVWSRVAGTTNPKTGMPNNVVLMPKAAAPEFTALRSQASEVLTTGELPKEYKAFDPAAGAVSAKNNKKKKNNNTPKGDGLLQDMQLKIAESRLEDRRALLKQVDELKQGLDKKGAGLDEFRQQAFDVILGGVTDAFNLSKEDPKVVAKYDTSHMRAPKWAVNKGTKNAKKIPWFEPMALGKQMLMARRLVEAGCGFVTVVSEGWDMHGNAFGINDGMPTLGPAVDHTVSTFLNDLKARGMEDDVLLVITGEMGRTPKINGKKGRDHWARICSLALAGGGLNMGQVIGQSDRNGGAPATNPYTVENLSATIMHTLFDIGELRVTSGLPTDVVRTATTTEPIRELF